MKNSLICCGLLALVSMSALSEPPPGHPSSSQAMEILMSGSPTRSEELPHQGEVLSAINANQFTYLEIQEESSVQWIAVPLMAVTPGSSIRYGNGRVMTNFYSRLLQRNFPRITFVKDLVVEAKR